MEKSNVVLLVENLKRSLERAESLGAEFREMAEMQDDRAADLNAQIMALGGLTVRNRLVLEDLPEDFVAIEDNGYWNNPYGGDAA